MRYTYDAVIERDGDAYSVSFPQLPEAVTFGETREEAVRRASEALVLALAERIEDGGEIPPQERAAEVLAVSVEVTGEDVERSKCMTIDQAAEELGVTPGRVSQLASAGKLQPVVFGRRRMVTIASVNARKKEREAVTA